MTKLNTSSFQSYVNTKLHIEPRPWFHHIFGCTQVCLHICICACVCVCLYVCGCLHRPLCLDVCTLMCKRQDVWVKKSRQGMCVTRESGMEVGRLNSECVCVAMCVRMCEVSGMHMHTHVYVFKCVSSYPAASVSRLCVVRGRVACVCTHIHEMRCVLMCVQTVCVCWGVQGPGSVLEVEAAECAPCSTSSCCISRNADWITT